MHSLIGRIGPCLRTDHLEPDAFPESRPLHAELAQGHWLFPKVFVHLSLEVGECGVWGISDTMPAQHILFAKPDCRM